MTETPSAQDVQKENLLIQLTAITDIVGELRVQIEKAFEAREAVPETITCYERCDAQADGIAQALQDGWIDISPDDGPSWNYLGWCPECQRAHEEEERRLNHGVVHPQKVLTTEEQRAQSTKGKQPNTLFPE